MLCLKSNSQFKFQLPLHFVSGFPFLIITFLTSFSFPQLLYIPTSILAPAISSPLPLQALSQDPNSLANLDQDLPNNMIHQVPIKSLPQEWLWCETWCSDESKAQAKTIDLCNNPLTKEPKLASAVRIVAEWADYDNEIRQFQEGIADKLSLPLPSYSGTTPPLPTVPPAGDGHQQAHKEL